MQDFISKIIIQGIDKFSATAKTIQNSISGLTLRSAQMNLAFNKLGATSAKLFNDLKYVGVAALGLGVGITYMTKKHAQAAEQLLLLSQKTGVSTDALQRLGYVAELNSVSTEELANAFKFLNKSISDAASDANSEAAVAFNSMGVSVVDATGKLKQADVVFNQLSDSFKNTADGPTKVQTAMKLLGRAGTTLLPTLNLGSKELARLGKEFERFGNLLSKDELKAAAELDDNFDRLAVTFRGLASIISQAFVPILGPMIKKFSEFVASNKELIKYDVLVFTRGLVSGLQSVWSALLNIGSIFGQVLDFFGGFKNVLLILAGIKIAQLAIDITAFITALAGISKVVGLTAALQIFAGAIKAIGAAFLLNPVVLFVAALVAVGVIVYNLNDAFREWADGVIDSVDRILAKMPALHKALDFGDVAFDLLNPNAPKAPGTGKAAGTNGPDTAASRFLSSEANKATDIAAAPKQSSNVFTDALASLGNILDKNKEAIAVNVNLVSDGGITLGNVDAPDNSNVAISTGAMF